MSEKVYMENLPNEMVAMIIQHTDPFTARKFSWTSSHFYNLIEQEYFNKRKKLHMADPNFWINPEKLFKPESYFDVRRCAEIPCFLDTIYAIAAEELSNIVFHDTK